MVVKHQPCHSVQIVLQHVCASNIRCKCAILFCPPCRDCTILEGSLRFAGRVPRCLGRVERKGDSREDYGHNGKLQPVPRRLRGPELFVRRFRPPPLTDAKPVPPSHRPTLTSSTYPFQLPLR